MAISSSRLAGALLALALAGCSDGVGPTLREEAGELRLLVAAGDDAMLPDRQLWVVDRGTRRPLGLGSFTGVYVTDLARDGRVAVALRRSGDQTYAFDRELWPDGTLRRVDSTLTGGRFDIGTARYAVGSGRVAYRILRDSGGTRRVYVAILDSTRTAVREIGGVIGPAYAWAPAWSLDGDELAIAGTDSVYVLAVDGSRKRAVHVPLAIELAWAPGRQLAVLEANDVGPTLRILDGELREVWRFRVRRNWTGLTWSPDGRQLAVVARGGAPDEQPSVDFVDVAARRVVTCTIPDAVVLGGWTPGGRSVVVNTSIGAHLVRSDCGGRVELLRDLGAHRRAWVFPG